MIVNNCSFCGKPLKVGYKIVARDGIRIPSKVTTLEPIFTKDGRPLYKNYFVHRECVEDLKEYITSRLNEEYN